MEISQKFPYVLSKLFKGLFIGFKVHIAGHFIGRPTQLNLTLRLEDYGFNFIAHFYVMLF